MQDFLVCFPMKYWDFSVKSKSILPLVVTSEITIFIFTVSKNGLFMNSELKILPKGLKCSKLVWNYGEDVNFPWSNHWRHLLCWSNAFSARDVRRTIIDSGIQYLHGFLGFYCFKCYLASFSRYKTKLSPNIMPLNTPNKTKLTRNG